MVTILTLESEEGVARMAFTHREAAEAVAHVLYAKLARVYMDDERSAGTFEQAQALWGFDLMDGHGLNIELAEAAESMFIPEKSAAWLFEKANCYDEGEE